MYKSIKILSLSIFLIVSSCGIRNRAHAGEYFTKNTTFAIVNDEDRIGTKIELERNLVSTGFNVISYKGALDAVKNRTSSKDNTVNKELEKIYSIKNIDDVYGIELFYEYYDDIFTYSYKKFYYRINNLNTGQFVMQGYHTGMQDTKKTVLKKLVAELSKKIKQS